MAAAPPLREGMRAEVIPEQSLVLACRTGLFPIDAGRAPCMQEVLFLSFSGLPGGLKEYVPIPY